MIPVAELLAFEQSAPTDRGAKKRAIREAFAISSARYYLELFHAIDRPEAMRIAPELTRSLLDQREQSRLRQGLREPVTVAAGVVARAEQASLFDTGRDTKSAIRGRTAATRPVSEGEARKVVGMSLADAAASEAWKARVDDAIVSFAAAGEPFTAEEVREVAGDPPSHPNAMGARFNAAAHRRIITRVGYRLATRATLHRHPLALWVGAEAATAGEGVA